MLSSSAAFNARVEGQSAPILFCPLFHFIALEVDEGDNQLFPQ